MFRLSMMLVLCASLTGCMACRPYAAVELGLGFHEVPTGKSLGGVPCDRCPDFRRPFPSQR